MGAWGLIVVSVIFSWVFLPCFFGSLVHSLRVVLGLFVLGSGASFCLCAWMLELH
jgi:hypothetical protein